jgi:hypothetical protein
MKIHVAQVYQDSAAIAEGTREVAHASACGF